MIDTLAIREWIFDLLIKFDFFWLDVPDVAIWARSITLARRPVNFGLLYS